MELLTKNSAPEKYSYSGYEIRYYSLSLFSYPNFDWDKTVIIFAVDNSSSVNTNNKKKIILVIGKGPTQGLDDTTIMAGGKYTNNVSR